MKHVLAFVMGFVAINSARADWFCDSDGTSQRRNTEIIYCDGSTSKDAYDIMRQEYYRIQNQIPDSEAKSTPLVNALRRYPVHAKWRIKRI